MAWREWFPDFRVPREIERLVEAGLLVDRTWRYDLSPNFDAVLSDGSKLTFWVEHPNTDKRIGQDKRYGITLAEPGELSVSLLETDDLKVAIEALRALLRAGGGPRMGDVGGYVVPMFHLVE